MVDSSGPGAVQFKTVFITGAAGFLGSHLCERFLKMGVPVIGVDNFSTGMKSNSQYLKKRAQELGCSFQFIEADVVQPWTSWLPADVQGDRNQVSHILHFASPASPPLYQKLGLETMLVNSTGTANAVAWADLCGAKVLFASTSEIYGDPDVSPQPETYWGNVNTYGIRSCYDEAKRFGESWIHTSNLKNKTRHGIIRIFNTYGPRMNPSDGRVIINFLVSAIRKKPITMYGDGSQTRSFCFVDDLVDGIVAYLKHDQVDPINLGNDKEFSILQVTEVIRGMFPDRAIEVQRLPLPADDPRQRRPDLSRAREKLGGWSPRIPLSEGLAKMRLWLETDAEIPEGWKP